MGNLRPCKKCGSDRGRYIAYGNGFSKKTTFRISCPKCGYCTKEKKTLGEAVYVWNSVNG